MDKNATEMLLPLWKQRAAYVDVCLVPSPTAGERYLPIHAVQYKGRRFVITAPSGPQHCKFRHICNAVIVEISDTDVASSLTIVEEVLSQGLPCAIAMTANTRSRLALQQSVLALESRGVPIIASISGAHDVVCMTLYKQQRDANTPEGALVRRLEELLAPASTLSQNAMPRTDAAPQPSQAICA